MRFLVALIAFIPLGAAATIYKWTDEEGRVVYANRAPEPGAKNVQVMKIDDAPAPASANAALEERVARLERELQAARQYPAPAPVPPMAYPAAMPRPPTVADYYAPTYGYAGYAYPMYGYPAFSYPVYLNRFPVRFVHRAPGFVRSTHISQHIGSRRR